MVERDCVSRTMSIAPVYTYLCVRHTFSVMDPKYVEMKFVVARKQFVVVLILILHPNYHTCSHQNVKSMTYITIPSEKGS